MSALQVTSVASAPATACVGNWLSECHPEMARGGLLLELNTENSDKCQAICANVKGCKFFVFQARSLELATCQLYNSAYKEFIARCQEIGGKADSAAIAPTCTAPAPGTCAMFRLGDCSFEGNAEESFDSPSGAEEDFCIGLANANKVEGYLWQKESKKCEIYSKKSMQGWQDSCKALSGPPDKSPKDCGLKTISAPLREPTQSSNTKPPCGAYSIGKCSIGHEPIEESSMPDIASCQKLCKISSGGVCKFFSFDSNGIDGTNCKLYDASFADVVSNGCDIMAGSASKDNLDSCLHPKEASPKSIIDADCDYQGIQEFEDAPGGLDFCLKFCATVKCKTWVFTKHDKKCRALSSADRKCSLFFGPP